MAEVIGAEGIRVRFTWAADATRRHAKRNGEAELAAQQLARALAALDAAGLCPTLDDGLAAGNAAIVAAPSRTTSPRSPRDLGSGDAATEGVGLWVSPSGRRPTTFSSKRDASPPHGSAAAMVHVVDFDPETWSATGHSPSGRKPSSDTPLHWAALIEAPRRFAWSAAPRIALHGHALDSVVEARALGIPISPVETLFSTPEDRRALMELLHEHPYPANKIWIRRGHGFFLLEETFEAAMAALDALIAKIHPR